MVNIAESVGAVNKWPHQLCLESKHITRQINLTNFSFALLTKNGQVICNVIFLMNTSTIFKFRKIDKRLIESLINEEVYFSPPSQLNDPFDCQIDIGKSLQVAISKVSGKEKKTLESFAMALGGFFSEVESKLRTFGIWSCSMDLENSLMWAHYGDEHRGICLTYELPDTFMDHSLGEVIGAHPIDYTTNPIVGWFIEQSKAELSPSFSEFGTPLIVKLLTSKDECWKYENEGRVISEKPGPKRIGKSALRQICFGLRTPENDKRLIKRILKNHGYDVPICEIDRNNNDFGLCAKKI